MAFPPIRTFFRLLHRRLNQSCTIQRVACIADIYHGIRVFSTCFLIQHNLRMSNVQLDMRIKNYLLHQNNWVYSKPRYINFVSNISNYFIPRNVYADKLILKEKFNFFFLLYLGDCGTFQAFFSIEKKI